jgi:predicted ATPase with chaperone activity
LPSVCESALNYDLLSCRHDRLSILKPCAYSSVLKVGHTIADLACTEEIELAYNAEAIRYGSLNRRL